MVHIHVHAVQVNTLRSQRFLCNFVFFRKQVGPVTIGLCSQPKRASLYYDITITNCSYPQRYYNVFTLIIQCTTVILQYNNNNNNLKT